MARYGDVLFSGRSGEKYLFQSWPFATRFRPVGAVFLVTKRVFTNPTYRRAHHEVIFIGATSSMSPLGTPAQMEAFEKQGANCICVHAIPDEGHRAKVVEDLCVHLSR